jgi:hypothetical protein
LSRIALPPVEVAEPNVHVPAVVTNAPVGAVIVVPSGDRSVATSADACMFVASTESPLVDGSAPPFPQPESPRRSSVARNNPKGILDPTSRWFDMTVTSMMIDYAQETPVY